MTSLAEIIAEESVWLRLGFVDDAVVVREDGAEALKQLGLDAEASDLRWRAFEVSATSTDQ